MRFGLYYASFAQEHSAAEIALTLAATARIADDGGVASLWVMDHYFQMDQVAPVDEPMLEAYSSLGYLACATERLDLGVLVTGVMYRYPGLLAKIITTLDVLSHGRAQLGIGASWYEREQRGLGVPVVPVSERFERLEETIQICLQMWSSNNGPYVGQHYQLAETLCVPAPVCAPHPPILVGGAGERKTLLLVARYAQACNIFSTGIDDVARKLNVLRAHCEAEGREFAAITKTVVLPRPPLADIDAYIAEAAAFSRIGVSEVISKPDRNPVDFTEQVVERLIPRLADIA